MRGGRGREKDKRDFFRELFTLCFHSLQLLFFLQPFSLSRSLSLFSRSLPLSLCVCYFYIFEALAAALSSFMQRSATTMISSPASRLALATASSSADSGFRSAARAPWAAPRRSPRRWEGPRASGSSRARRPSPAATRAPRGKEAGLSREVAGFAAASRSKDGNRNHLDAVAAEEVGDVEGRARPVGVRPRAEHGDDARRGGDLQRDCAAISLSLESFEG